MSNSTSEENENFNVASIKKSLLSRKLEKQIIATKVLYRLLKNNPSPEYHVKLMNADLIEMLCEASCTTNIMLLKYVFKCFYIFTKQTQFFEQNRTAHTLETTIRALHIFTKTQGKNEIFILGLQLVYDVIRKLNSQDIIISTMCNVPNLLNLVKKILKHSSDKMNVYIGTEVIICLLNGTGILKFKTLMEEIILESLELLSGINKKCYDNTCIILMSEVVNGSMRCFVQAKIDAVQSTIFSQLLSVMKDILIPFLLENYEKCVESDYDMLKIILSTLLSMYYYPQELATEKFTHFIILKGFLHFLPKIEGRCNNTKLRIVVRSLLYESIQCISSSVLGKENWKNLLIPGFEALPLGGSYTTILIQESNEIIPIASIVFNYFFLMSSWSLNVDKDCLKSVSHYILSLTDVPSPPITKALWFVFAVAYLNNYDKVHYSKIAMTKLLKFIMQYDIDEVYTHHPAMLYWGFSDNSVFPEVQLRIIKFWVNENDLESNEELKKLLKINKESCFTVMEIMASEYKLSAEIHKILTSNVEKSEFDSSHIFKCAWSMLPKYLVKFSTYNDPSLYECLTNVMQLCCQSKPKNFDISLILRISCLLPGTFLKYFDTDEIRERLKVDEKYSLTIRNTFSLIHDLIKTSLEVQDKRVPAVFLKHERFINAIELILSWDGDLNSASLMRLITLFLQYQKQSMQQSTKIISIEAIKLIKFLCGKADLCITTLMFLAVYLEIIVSKDVLPIVCVPLPTAIELRVLYFHIQMICAKSEDEVLTLCWICLRRLLELSDSIGLKEHLASTPITLMILSRGMETVAWKEIVSFITIWLPTVPTQSSRALNTPSALITLKELSEKISKKTMDPSIERAVSKLISFSKIEPEVPKKIDI